jgi:hypothetical protein
MTMRRLVIGFAMFLMLGIAGTASGRAQCPQMPELGNPSVRLEVMDPQLIFRHDVDLFGLSKIRKTFEKAPRGSYMLGVTMRNDQLNLQMKSKVLQLAKDRYCLWPTEITGQLGNRTMDVYVAANYITGTCEYKAVLDHENIHVSINRSVIKAYGPRIEAQLRLAAKSSLFPMVVTATSSQQALKALSAAVQAQVSQMEEELRQRNGAIDTPESYRRTAALCHNWFPKGTLLPRPD